MANDFALHLIEGNIVPMQDATTISGFKIGSKYYTRLTTTALQNYPVDFHIMPHCYNISTYYCSAKGEYINDDGVLLNQTA